MDVLMGERDRGGRDLRALSIVLGSGRESVALVSDAMPTVVTLSQRPGHTVRQLHVVRGQGLASRTLAVNTAATSLLRRCIGLRGRGEDAVNGGHSLLVARAGIFEGDTCFSIENQPLGILNQCFECSYLPATPTLE